jgi:hypothetical protein
MLDANMKQKACPHRDAPPPGVNVYTKDNYSIYEIDGEKNKLYAQNLCLFAKLFLDTKSVFYDVTTFLYYLLVAHNPTPDIPITGLGEDGVGQQSGVHIGVSAVAETRLGPDTHGREL